VNLLASRFRRVETFLIFQKAAPSRARVARRIFRKKGDVEMLVFKSGQYIQGSKGGGWELPKSPRNTQSSQGGPREFLSRPKKARNTKKFQG